MNALLLNCRCPSRTQTRASHGWLHNFRRRYPGLSIKTPSLIDPGRARMSHADVMDSFFNDVGSFMEQTGILNDSTRIYNIDESWIAPQEIKKRKVIVPKILSMPYKTFGGAQEHVTLAMCACANGDWMPPMVIFKGNVPTGADVIAEGPQNAIYTSTESGHIDTSNYFEYIKHLEPFLSPNRPVVIFQDNLSSHENYALAEFCVRHGVHLFNFPPKTSHLLQPLDKLFGPLKSKFEQKRAEANLIQQKYVANSKIPIILRFAMAAITKETIVNSFTKTGIFPLNRRAIADDLLVGSVSDISNNEVPSTSQTNVDDTQGESLSLMMDVCEGTDSETPDNSTTFEEKEIQTDAIKSLPCSVCISTDVTLHPAVAAGVVDVELASVFIPETVSGAAPSKTKQSRRSNKGRCITSESEIERMRAKQAEEAEKERMKQQKKEEKEHKRQQREESIKAKEAARKLKETRKREENTAKEQSKVGKISRGKCLTCASKVSKFERAVCVLCSVMYHKRCAGIAPSDCTLVCQMCNLL